MATSVRHTYNGFHLHSALQCLRAGYEGNAISWMVRDLGEVVGEDEYPVPGTLDIELSYQVDANLNRMEVITYEPAGEHWRGVAGDGI